VTGVLNTPLSRGKSRTGSIPNRCRDSQRRDRPGEPVPARSRRACLKTCRIGKCVNSPIATTTHNRTSCDNWHARCPSHPVVSGACRIRGLPNPLGSDDALPSNPPIRHHLFIHRPARASLLVQRHRLLEILAGVTNRKISGDCGLRFHERHCGLSGAFSNFMQYALLCTRRTRLSHGNNQQGLCVWVGRGGWRQCEAWGGGSGSLDCQFSQTVSIDSDYDAYSHLGPCDAINPETAIRRYHRMTKTSLSASPSSGLPSTIPGG